MLACQKQGLVDQLEKDRYNNIMGIVSYYLPTVVAVLPFTSIAPYITTTLISISPEIQSRVVFLFILVKDQRP